MNPLCILRDKSGESDLAVPIAVTADSDWLAIRPQGYGEAEALDGQGDPILLEVWQGQLRLLIATDINDPNKSVISLEGAREDRRCEVSGREASPPPELLEHREHPWRTDVAQVHGVGTAGSLALQLIARALWFRCTPLPADEFEFAVKVEHGQTLRGLVACNVPVSPDSVKPSLRMRQRHPKDVLSPAQRTAADADAVERFRPCAESGQRLWMETTFCGTWCGTYRLEEEGDEFAHSSRYQLVHIYEPHSRTDSAG